MQRLNYELLFACWCSGQISPRQWDEHLRDEVFCAWIRRHHGLVPNP